MSIQTNQGQHDRWQRSIEQWSNVTDRLGSTIDPGILETVVALNLLSLQTVASCEGHPDRAAAYPWIDIGYHDSDPEIAADIKEWMDLQDQASAARQAAGLEDHHMRSAEHLRAARKELEPMWDILHQAGDVQTRIEITSRRLLMPLLPLLDEFYAQHHSAYEQHLVLNMHEINGSARLYSLGAAFQDARPDDIKRQKLIAYQEEMQAFTQFLKTKLDVRSESEPSPSYQRERDSV